MCYSINNLLDSCSMFRGHRAKVQTSDAYLLDQYPTKAMADEEQGTLGL